MASTDHFLRELRAQLARASASGLAEALVNANKLHRMLGGYPGSQHGMQHCCDAMHTEMQPGDFLVENGEDNLTVRYHLPRKSHGE